MQDGWATWSLCLCYAVEVEKDGKEMTNPSVIVLKTGVLKQGVKREYQSRS